MKGLSVKRIRFGYGKKEVLSDVSFEMTPSSFNALVGKNGCGKTTLLFCLTGFFEIPDGEISWDGHEIRKYSLEDLAKKVALVDSEKWEYVPYSVRDLLLLGRSPHAGFWGKFSEKDEEKVEEISEKFDLKKFWDRPFQELSRGEEQRVKLAIALVREPDYLLLDEPTSHLDPFFQREAIEILKEFVKKKSIGLIAVIHDISLLKFFERCLVLENGRISHEFRNPGGDLNTLSEIEGLYYRCS